MSTQERLSGIFSRGTSDEWIPAVIKLVESEKALLVEEIVGDLESNPTPGQEFINLPFWIESKQQQLRTKYLNKPL